VGIHPSAIVDPRARLDPSVEVGPFAVVEAETELGPGCEIRAHAVVKRYTRLGAANVIHEGAVLGGEPQDLAFQPGATRLEIGDGNRIREGVTIHGAAAPAAPTRVGSGCYLMAYAHVAHDCELQDGVILANNVALAGHVSVGERAFLSGGVVVHQHCRVGRLAMIGGNAKVTQDCLPFVTTDGVPALAKGLNVLGLRRAGFRASELRQLKEAYRVLLRSSLPLEKALAELESAGDLARELAAFVRGSRRSFHRSAESPARLER
jgi:UDP-N-acetylglucosamine acyltransferase